MLGLYYSFNHIATLPQDDEVMDWYSSCWISGDSVSVAIIIFKLQEDKEKGNEMNAYIYTKTYNINKFICLWGNDYKLKHLLYVIFHKERCNCL